MAQWERLFLASECGPGRQRFVSIGGVELAVFHLADGGGFVAVANSCPHAGGNLSAGEIHRGTVTCPMHQWKFDLNTGHCVGTDDVFLKRYACKVEHGAVWANLSKPLPIAPPPKYEF